MKQTTKNDIKAWVLTTIICGVLAFAWRPILTLTFDFIRSIDFNSHATRVEFLKSQIVYKSNNLSLDEKLKVLELLKNEDKEENLTKIDSMLSK